MASSSTLDHIWTYRVFASFHGQDVRKTFLSHFRKQFNHNGIKMFYDQEIERGQTIGPALIQAIRESRISILILSKNYASSSWCLDELLEILKCKDDIGQIVMTVFYGVDPSDVRKQTGEFGEAFHKTCARKTEEERRRYSRALTKAANIAGEDFQNWDSEADMIEKIAKDVSDKLNVTSSWDFEGMVGIEAHLRKMTSLLDLDCGGVKMVGVSGPAGIGKSTIARALHSLLANKFQLTCFMDNLRGSYPIGLDEYGLKLRLQEEFLSKVLNQDGTRVYNLGVIKHRLHDQKVLIILDNVNNIKQLEALANETTWFGPGSRILVITEDKELLQQHGINNMYDVGFPSDETALKILSGYAFKQSYPHNGFEKLANRIIKLCGYLPLGLRVVGTSLRGKNEEEWEEVIRRLDNILDHQDIEEVLRVGYENLHENEQSLFLHIAVFFNDKDGDHVKAMFADNNSDIRHGLKILFNKSLISISTKGEIGMHKLLQQMGTKVIHREKPWKRRILIDASEICHVLERAKGTRDRDVSGISFDISDVYEVSVSKIAFKRMPNLRFLRVYKSKDDGTGIVHIPEELEFPQRLRLLDWRAYPGKSLPHTFNPVYLVELNLRDNKFEKLWLGTQPLTHLKRMDLLGSFCLKELPDLSNATNLESLTLSACFSLVEIPSYIGNLPKLEQLQLQFCRKLQVIPTHFNLGSLAFVDMMGCTRFTKFPDISSSTNIQAFVITDTMLEELPKSISPWCNLQKLSIYGSVHPWSSYSDRNAADIEKLPDWIKDLPRLESLRVVGCPKLTSLPELPGSVRTVRAKDCESLKTLTSFPLDSPVEEMYFTNCFNLGRKARKVIMQQSLTACLPGVEIPAEFSNQAIGDSLTIRSDCYRFRVCALVCPRQGMEDDLSGISCHVCLNGSHNHRVHFNRLFRIQTYHLFVAYSELLDEDGGCLGLENEISFRFNTGSQNINIIECGVQILTSTVGRNKYGLDQVSEDEDDLGYEELEDFDMAFEQEEEEEEDNVKRKEDAYCWSWFVLCFDFSHVVSKIRSFDWGRRQQNPGRST